MKKLTLEFTADDLPNGLVAAKGTDIWLALWDVSQALRAEWKYSESEEKKTEAEWADDFHEKFWEILNHYSITLEELD